MPVNASSERAMERTPLSTPDTLRVRCPHCRKLYMVQFSDIQEAKPRFECVQCHNRFWISLTDIDISLEIMGLPLHIKQPLARSKSVSTKKDPCPKCFKPVESGRSECPHCGVVIEKYRDALAFSEGATPHSAALSTLWRKIVADYGDEALHSDFIRSCQRERNLAFAAAQYTQMQKLMPSDETTNRRLREVLSLAFASLPSPTRDVRVPRFYSRLWQLPLMGATLVMIVGMVLPMFRDLVGLGALLLFLAAMLQIQFRRRA